MTRKQWIAYNKVRDALTFDHVLGHYGIEPPKRPSRDGQLMVHCPFHEDSTPSCSINTQKHIFRCFGCGEHGNVLEFVVKMEGGEPDNKEDMYAGAKYAVEAILGASLSEYGRDDNGAPDRVRAKSKDQPEAEKDDAPPPRVQAKQKRGQAEPQNEASTEAADDQEEEPITENKVIDIHLDLDPEHEMLVGRGIDKATAERFEIGYCKAGIMKGRIAFPIHNLAGDLVAYVGRWAEEDVPEKTLRYKFPKGFAKALELWNIHRAAHYARELGKKHLTLVEGYWSTIRLDGMGIPVAALMGTSCSDEQAQLIRAAGFKYVTLMLDGDDAGRQAAMANAAILAQHVYVRIVELPEGLKPDSVPEDFLEPYRVATR